jgi:hypothetical protein
MNLIDDKNIVVNSLIHPKGSGYSVGDIIHASKKLSRHKFINCWKIDKLDELAGEVVHSYANYVNVNMYMSVYPHQPSVFPVLVECEIPKGETYWAGHMLDVDQYGSLSLRIKKAYTKIWKVYFGAVSSYYVVAPMDFVTIDRLKSDLNADQNYYLYEFDAVTGEEKFVYEHIGLNDI